MASNRWRFVTVCLIAVMCGWGAKALTITGGGEIKGFDGIQVGVSQGAHACTISEPFEVMPGTTFTFESKAGDAVFMFQGQFGGFDSTDHNRPIIQLKVDGVNVGLAVVGSDVTHVGLIPGLETFGYNAFTNLAAGTHTASVEWHTFPIGAKSCVEERSLIVLHR